MIAIISKRTGKTIPFFFAATKVNKKAKKQQITGIAIAIRLPTNIRLPAASFALLYA